LPEDGLSRPDPANGIAESCRYHRLHAGSAVRDKNEKTPPSFCAGWGLQGFGEALVGGGMIQPRSPLKFTLEILLYAESTLMSKILATVFAFTFAAGFFCYLKEVASRRSTLMRPDA